MNWWTILSATWINLQRITDSILPSTDFEIDVTNFEACFEIIETFCEKPSLVCSIPVGWAQAHELRLCEDC